MDLRTATQKRAAEALPEPTITGSGPDASLDGNLVVHVEPYEATDRYGDRWLVRVWYDNTSAIQAEGSPMKKDGTPAARSQQIVGIPVPANVRALIEESRTQRTAAKAKPLTTDHFGRGNSVSILPPPGSISARRSGTVTGTEGDMVLVEVKTYGKVRSGQPASRSNRTINNRRTMRFEPSRLRHEGGLCDVCRSQERR